MWWGIGITLMLVAAAIYCGMRTPASSTPAGSVRSAHHPHHPQSKHRRAASSAMVTPLDTSAIKHARVPTRYQGMR